jgi:hypothetical protein
VWWTMSSRICFIVFRTPQLFAAHTGAARNDDWYEY